MKSFKDHPHLNPLPSRERNFLSPPLAGGINVQAPVPSPGDRVAIVEGIGNINVL